MLLSSDVSHTLLIQITPHFFLLLFYWIQTYHCSAFNSFLICISVFTCCCPRLCLPETDTQPTYPHVQTSTHRLRKKNALLPDWFIGLHLRELPPPPPDDGSLISEASNWNVPVACIFLFPVWCKHYYHYCKILIFNMYSKVLLTYSLLQNQYSTIYYPKKLSFLSIVKHSLKDPSQFNIILVKWFLIHFAVGNSLQFYCSFTLSHLF